ncbi:MAG TPA: GNAT family N-acetyltransferase [Gemmatimonadaceae bacterium]|nr:GNAT family N-acetyltransferase [Gemmatimonadaceae bacterium]
MTAVRLGALQRTHRGRLREILDATAVFRQDEVDIALELFDDDGDYEFLGGFDDDDLVAYACFGATPGTDRTFDLYWIAVHPVAQRHGGGSRLLSEVEQRLVDRGARLLVVETSSRPEYDATRRFYLARGYQEVARMRDFYAIGDDRVIYTKSLSPLALAPSPSVHE